MLSSGVYIILNKKSSKCYVGSTINFHKRKMGHFRDLRKNKHHCRYFQRAYNKYGSDMFEFSVLATCPSEKYYLEKLENKFFEIYNNKLYNHQKKAFRNFKNSFTNAILKKNQVLDIYKIILNNPLIDIKIVAKKYKIKQSAIYSIILKENWKEVTKGLPDIDLSATQGFKLSKKIKGKIPKNCTNLNFEIVKTIRNLYPDISEKEIAQKYDLTLYTVQRMLQNIIWKDPNYTPKLNKRYSQLTEKEIQYIRDNLNILSVSVIASNLNRAKTTIRTQIKKYKNEKL